MEIIKKIRSVLLLAALILFIYQTTLAIIHYIESPTVIVNSETEVNENLLPRKDEEIYCQYSIPKALIRSFLTSFLTTQ